MWFFYFALLLGGLIFFHELGHFLVGKLMGVRVLKFAIGFGPAIPFLKFRHGETEYSINMIPLGGYVKFFGDDPTEDVPLEERRGSFTWAPLWRRFLIVLAGPVFNLILPLIILFPRYLGETQTEAAILGHIEAGGAAAQAKVVEEPEGITLGDGLRAGDRVVRIDGAEVSNWWEMERIISASAGRALHITVRRDGQLATYLVTPEATVSGRIQELDWEEWKGRIGVAGRGLAPVFAVELDSPAARAGFRTGDRVVAIEGEPVGDASVEQVMARLQARSGQPTALVVLRDGEGKAGTEPLGLALDRLPHAVELRLPSVVVAADGSVSGLRPAEMVVADVHPKTPASDQLGLLPGDRVTAVDGRPVSAWYPMLGRIMIDERPRHEITIVRGRTPALASAMLATVGLTAAEVRGDSDSEGRTVVRVLAIDYERLRKLRKPWVFGAYHAGEYLPAPLVERNNRFTYAVTQSVEETVHWFKITVLTVVGLFRGQVPMEDLGGPIMIADLAAKTEQLGWGYFFKLMVLLSINLGILNLLPVPILDGGHLMFFTIEAVKRKPLSLRARQLASYVGLALIVLLMAVAFKNDLSRYWETIAGGVGCGVAGF